MAILPIIFWVLINSEMRNIEEASVGHDDMRGTVALDFCGGYTYLSEYAEKKGIDLEKYEPVGLEVSYDEDNYFELIFLVVDRQNSNKNDDGRLPLIEITVSKNKKDFEEEFKSLCIQLFRRDKNRSNYYKSESMS